MDDNHQAVAWARASYIRRFRGVDVGHPAARPRTVTKAFEWLTPQYTEARWQVLSQIPTDRFEDPHLYVLGSMAWAMTCQYPLSSFDDIEWNYSRTQLLSRIHDGSVLVDGEACTWSPYRWRSSRVISEVQDSIDKVAWMTRKPGHSGTNTRMIPGDPSALFLLPPIRSTSPSLSYPKFGPPESSLTRASASGLQAWIDVREAVLEMGTGYLQAAWYDRQGGKRRVRSALEKAGIQWRDQLTDDFYTQQWEDPKTGSEVHIKRYYTSRQALATPEQLAAALRDAQA